MKWVGSSVVELWTENPGVAGSIPALPTYKLLGLSRYSLLTLRSVMTKGLELRHRIQCG